MDQRKAIEEKIAALDAQRRAIQDGIFQMNLRRNPSIGMMPREIQQMDHIAFQNALKPTLNQQKEVEKQISQARADLAKYDRDQRYAAADQERAQKAVEAQKKAQVAAQKDAESQLEKKSAAAFGLGPNKGISYLNGRKENLFYDPKMGKIGVPNASPDNTKPATPKGDSEAKAQVQDAVNGYARASGIQGTIHPASIFAEGGFKRTEDDQGNYIYHAPGGDISIPKGDADAIEGRYKKSLAPAPEAPSTGVKYIPVNTFNQANSLLGQVTGESVPNPVERFIASRSANRQAGGTNGPGDVRPFPSAISQAVPEWGAADSTPVRTSVPSVDQSTQFDANGNRVGPTDLTRIQPTTYTVPDTFAPTAQFGQVPAVATTKVIPRPITSTDLNVAPEPVFNAMSVLNSGVNPIFAQIAARKGQPEPGSPEAQTNDYIKQRATASRVPADKIADVVKRVTSLNPKDSNEFNNLVSEGIGQLPEVKNRNLVEMLNANPTVGALAQGVNNVFGGPSTGGPLAPYARALSGSGPIARREAPIVDALIPDTYGNTDLVEAAKRIQIMKGLIPADTTTKQFVADRINADQDAQDQAAQLPIF